MLMVLRTDLSEIFGACPLDTDLSVEILEAELVREDLMSDGLGVEGTGRFGDGDGALVTSGGIGRLVLGL